MTKKPPASRKRLIPTRSKPANQRPIGLGAIADALGYNLRRAQMPVFKAFAATFASHDIRPVQFSILTILRANPGLKQTELGGVLAIKRANFVALVDELEQRGLVVRRRQPKDGRAYALHLTPAGQTFTAKLERLHATLEKRLADTLGPKAHRQLLALLKSVQNAGSED